MMSIFIAVWAALLNFLVHIRIITLLVAASLTIFISVMAVLFPKLSTKIPVIVFVSKDAVLLLGLYLHTWSLIDLAV